MKDLKFDWDLWNYQKNDIKHGESMTEAESVFYDPSYRLYSDRKHSSRSERRYILYGKSMEGRVLMIGFTIRGRVIRIITSRPASRKEREVYETGR